MTNRKITNLYDVEFTPFDNYGVVVPGMRVGIKLVIIKKMVDKELMF